MNERTIEACSMSRCGCKFCLFMFCRLTWNRFSVFYCVRLNEKYIKITSNSTDASTLRRASKSDSLFYVRLVHIQRGLAGVGFGFDVTKSLAIPVRQIRRK